MDCLLSAPRRHDILGMLNQDSTRGLGQLIDGEARGRNNTGGQGVKSQAWARVKIGDQIWAACCERVFSSQSMHSPTLKRPEPRATAT